jgi:carbon monoxide dehydrogenase subunit G
VPLRIDERFVVNAPVERVWAFLVDPRRVVACVPGGELGDVLDERTFRGAVRVVVGPLTLAYRGRVTLAEVDVARRRVTILGDARETDGGGGSARLSLVSWLAARPGGGTEVVAPATVDVAGRIVELGRGVLEPLGHLVFQEFAAEVRATLEAEEAARGAAGTAPPARPPPPPLRAIPLVARALRAWIAAWLRARGGRAR